MNAGAGRGAACGFAAAGTIPGGKVPSGTDIFENVIIRAAVLY